MEHLPLNIVNHNKYMRLTKKGVPGQLLHKYQALHQPEYRASTAARELIHSLYIIAELISCSE